MSKKIIISDIDSRDVYELSPIIVTVKSEVPATTILGDYIASIKDELVITTSLIDGEAIDFSGAELRVPITRYANDKVTDDEVYFIATITAGVLVATGQLERSGDWQLRTERINVSLERLGQDWKLAQATVKFVI